MTLGTNRKIRNPRSEIRTWKNYLIIITLLGFWILLALSIVEGLFGFNDSSFAFSQPPKNNTETAPTSESFSFTVFGDSHDSYDIFACLIEQVNGEDVAFAVHLGDAVQSPSEREYLNYLKMISGLKVKLYQVPGNHDLAGNGYKYYKKYFGPYYYSFDFKNSHFVVLNNAFPESFTADQFAWLKKDLAETDKENIFIFMHRPIFDPAEVFQGYVMSGREVIRELMRLFNKYGVDYVFAGHIHCYAKVRRNGIVYIVSGGAGAQLHLPKDFGGFHHYVKIEVAGNSITDKVVMVYERE
jgi:Icc protein